MSLLKPWKPATITISPWSIPSLTLSPVISSISAFPCLEVVIIPACEPVKEKELYPKLFRCMDNKDIVILSPADKSMSISLGVGFSESSLARWINSSVLEPIAEGTTTTSLLSFLHSIILSATSFNEFVSATLVPPNFCTIKVIGNILISFLKN